MPTSLSNRKDALPIVWWLLVYQILDTQGSFLSLGSTRAADATSHSFAVTPRRPRRGGAERRGGSSREEMNVETRSSRLAVRLLHAPYFPQALAHAPVEVYVAPSCPVCPERGFQLRGKYVFVEDRGRCVQHPSPTLQTYDDLLPEQ